MIHINISQLTPSEEWNKKASELTQKLRDAKDKAERDAIIDGNAHWKDLKEELKKPSYGKCWYSEAREIYSYYHVDHFRPKKRAFNLDKEDKGGYWWLTYDWQNYRLCGGVGNTIKGDRFPVKYNKANAPGDPLDDEVIYFLDPTDADDVKLLNFDEEGKVIPANPNNNDWEYIRANETIKWFNLNYSDLKDERKRAWVQTSRHIDKVESLREAMNFSPTATKRAQLKDEYEHLRKLIAPCTELSSTIRCCLRSSGHNWALKLLEQPVNAEAYCQEYT